MLKISVEEVMEYLGIDYEDDPTENRINHLISVANLHLKGALGENYPGEDTRVKEMALIIIEDLYDNHDLNDKVSGNIRRLINDFTLQIKCEMKRKKVYQNGI